MNLRSLLLSAVGAALGSLNGHALAQPATNSFNQGLRLAPNQWTVPWQPPALAGSNSPFLNVPTNVPRLVLPGAVPSTNRPFVPGKPGVYKSLPYTCLVVVPQPHADEQGILGPAGKQPLTRMPQMPGPEFKMPIIRPELRFVPLPQK